MKQYPEIQGPNKAPREHCIAFYKYDGSNIRAEWSRKKGWSKFGSKNVLIDGTHPLGDAIGIFLDTYSTDLVYVFKNSKLFHGCQNVTVFGEYFGVNSFAGWHDEKDTKEIVMIDVSIHKKGFMTPRDFVKTFKHLRIPYIVYEGNFNASFIQDVKDGMWNLEEGVVAKGLLPHGKPPHNLWMAKIKTKKWMSRLQEACERHPEIWGKELIDNTEEQNEI
tara:strand:- start:1943 stop:2602 length:660 start_codon:yes stop_codon:yes gene_type:complete